MRVLTAPLEELGEFEEIKRKKRNLRSHKAAESGNYRNRFPLQHPPHRRGDVGDVVLVVCGGYQHFAFVHENLQLGVQRDARR